jgi:hypothetical protein
MKIPVHIVRLLSLFIFLAKLCMIGCIPVAAQVKYKQSKVNKLQYGFGFKISTSIASKRPVVRVSANAGSGYEFGPLYPTIHLQFQVYNGGIGTGFIRPQYTRFMADFSQSLMLTLGGRRAYRNLSATDYGQRNSPLYYFSDFCTPALQNPYGFSLSVGANFITAWGKGRGRNQRAGFFDIHIGAFQFGYSNDGTPFSGSKLGDGEDRYYTGDGFAAVHLSRKWEINTYMISYHRFTGYYKKAFEVANALFLANVDYGDTLQQYFNRSAYNFSAASMDRGLSVSFDLRNRYFKDVQHLIHLNDYWVLHQVPYRYAKGVSISYFNNYSYLIRKK